jgi:hypothetical protein
MTKKIAIKEMGAVREMLLSNSFQIDALAQLMLEKGLISEQEYLDKLKKVQADFQRRVKDAG